MQYHDHGMVLGDFQPATPLTSKGSELEQE